MRFNEKKDVRLRDVTGRGACFLFFTDLERAQKVARFATFVLVSNRH
jgi:hypothetical protein